MKELLKKLLLDGGHVKKGGPFSLSSGAVSNIYFDIKGAMLKPNCLIRIAIESIREIDKFDKDNVVTYIGGLELGSALLTVGIVSCSSYNGFVIRKSSKGYGTNQRVEGGMVGAKCIIVEDVTTTGKSALEAVNIAKEFGMDVLAVFSLLDRNHGASQLFESKKIPFFNFLCESDF
jgi:orotate phosphoribosyltransferase